MPGVRPGGRLTFLSLDKKVSKESSPAASVPALRSGQPAVLGHGVCGETLYALRAPFKQTPQIS